MAFLSDMSLPGGDDLLGEKSGRDCLDSIACCDLRTWIRAAGDAVDGTKTDTMHRGGPQA